VHQFRQNRDSWEGVAYAGIPSYSEDLWRNSPLLHFIAASPISDSFTVYANANDALYFGTRRNALPLPHKDIPQEIRAYDMAKPIALVWFFYGLNEDLIGLERALQGRKLIRSYQFKDGLLLYCQ
jgi:hypothetical protein